MALKKKTGNKKQSKPLVYVLEGVFGALFAALLGARKQEKRRWLTGALCGVVYIVISLAVFGLASGEFSIGSSTAVDALMCLLAGMTGGIILSLAE